MKFAHFFSGLEEEIQTKFCTKLDLLHFKPNSHRDAYNAVYTMLMH